MVQSLIQLAKTEPLNVAILFTAIIVFTFVAVRSELKNWRVSKTLKYFRDLKHEQNQLSHVLRSNKEIQYKQIACYNYLDEQEKILLLKKNGKLEVSIFNDLIKPLVIETIKLDIMSTYIAEISKQNDDIDPSEISYPLLFQLLIDHDDDSIYIDKEV